MQPFKLNQAGSIRIPQSKKLTRTTQTSFVSSPDVPVEVRRRGRPSKSRHAGQSGQLQKHEELHLGVMALERFVMENNDELAGFFPSRQFLVSKGRSDLATVVKKLGGPDRAAEGMRLTWMPERERERFIQSQVAEALSAATQPALTHLKVGPHEVQRVIVNLLSRGKQFLVEHSESNVESSTTYWRMWYTPLSTSEFNSPSEGLQKLLVEAHRCSQTHRNHFVRIMAFDPVTQSQLSSFVLFRPTAPTQPSKFSSKPFYHAARAPSS